jgi:hypothetical protein
MCSEPHISRQRDSCLTSNVVRKMKHESIAFRITISLSSALAFFILGVLGESFLNIYALVSHGRQIIPPVITALVLDGFLLNRSCFLVSMNPFIISIICLPFLCRKRSPATAYWCWFFTIWLAVVAYFLMFTTALILPFYMLGVQIGDSPVPKIIYVVDVIEVIGIVYAVFWFRKKAMPNRSSEIQKSPKAVEPTIMAVSVLVNSFIASLTGTSSPAHLWRFIFGRVPNAMQTKEIV